ncbi:PhzF family phenazine biosynthesis protein [Lutibacter sp. B1]|uniref:PhzF family phenazine biosynthesis protein n=1 Tax=Lutibacter sp. B1 TaxID=2725996 RepID=UPI0014573EC0|nr:PhzF family phenazine biosynthesis protein [Lutibacter sp. B1]NLP57884.1 PhzF family phenazine biosynthesis protein [Lutibacter sp. B1]
MTIYQVDAFTNEVFKGNPAAVCPLNEWISDNLMQKIAEENNLSETVFFVKNNDLFDIRWFTPSCEIDLCGHATLAAAHILFSEMGFNKSQLNFNSKSGVLTVTKNDNWYTLNFPSEEIEEIETPLILKQSLNVPILKTYKGKWKCLVELENEEVIKNLAPNFSLLSSLEFPGIIVTSQGNEVDFVSRFFAPKIGINEDPVTGSAHTLLIPYWAKKLNKNKLEAVQLSKRSGYLKCKFLNDRIEMSGQAVTYLKGKLTTQT